MAPPRLVNINRISRHGLRVIICGGRNFANWPAMWAWLDRFDTCERIGHVIDGAQQKRLPDDSIAGADYWAHGWAVARGKETTRYPVSPGDWRRLGKAAGPIRNQRMLDAGRPDAVIAFPGGAGTADMVRRAREAGVRVVEVANRELVS